MVRYLMVFFSSGVSPFAGLRAQRPGYGSVNPAGSGGREHSRAGEFDSQAAGLLALGAFSCERVASGELALFRKAIGRHGSGGAFLFPGPIEVKEAGTAPA